MQEYFCTAQINICRMICQSTISAETMIFNKQSNKNNMFQQIESTAEN